MTDLETVLNDLITSFIDTFHIQSSLSAAIQWMTFFDSDLSLEQKQRFKLALRDYMLTNSINDNKVMEYLDLDKIGH